MTSALAYGGAFHCIREAREATSDADRLLWLVKAKRWRDLARMIRRAGR